MARREERHWWYAGMRRVALAVLEQRARRATRIAHSGRWLRHRRDDRSRCAALARSSASTSPGKALEPARATRPERRWPARRSSSCRSARDVRRGHQLRSRLPPGCGNDSARCREMRRVLKPGACFLLRVQRTTGCAASTIGWSTRGIAIRRDEVQRQARATRVSRRPADLGQLAALPARSRQAIARASQGDADERPANRTCGSRPGRSTALLESAVAVESLAIPRGVPLPFGLRCWLSLAPCEPRRWPRRRSVDARSARRGDAEAPGGEVASPRGDRRAGVCVACPASRRPVRRARLLRAGHAALLLPARAWVSQQLHAGMLPALAARHLHRLPDLRRRRARAWPIRRRCLARPAAGRRWRWSGCGCCTCSWLALFTFALSADAPAADRCPRSAARWSSPSAASSARRCITKTWCARRSGCPARCCAWSGRTPQRGRSA